MSKSKTPSSPSLKDWEKQATSELNGKASSSIHWETAEGIEIKPLYTAQDLEKFDYTETLSGFSPFTRGPRSTMYSAVHGQSGNMPAFRLQKSQMLFTEKIWRTVKKD